MNVFLVGFGSCLGGIARYALVQLTDGWNAALPLSTIAVNAIGCLLIGFLNGWAFSGKHASASQSWHLFLVVGICGGFTTFSAFTAQTFDLLAAGAWFRAVLNTTISILLCLTTVALGHSLAQVASRPRG